MHARRRLFAATLFIAGTSLHAQDLATSCHASSSFDLTVAPDHLLFDRPDPVPHRVELHDGSLRVDGVAVKVRDDEQDRLALFEYDARALLPRIRDVANYGVDLLTAALHDEAARMPLAADTRAELDRRLAAHAIELHQRIARSQSTHDWQGDLADQYTSELAADIVPLVATDLGQQAVDAAVNGDLQQAAALRDLATGLRPRIEQRLHVLAPEVKALCPAIQRMAELQQGIRDGSGRPLDLLQVGP